MASPGNQHCANCIGTLSFPAVGATVAWCKMLQLETTFVEFLHDLTPRGYTLQNVAGTELVRKVLSKHVKTFWKPAAITVMAPTVWRELVFACVSVQHVRARMRDGSERRPVVMVFVVNLLTQ